MKRLDPSAEAFTRNSLPAEDAAHPAPEAPAGHIMSETKPLPAARLDPAAHYTREALQKLLAAYSGDKLETLSDSQLDQLEADLSGSIQNNKQGLMGWAGLRGQTREQMLSEKLNTVRALRNERLKHRQSAQAAISPPKSLGVQSSALLADFPTQLRANPATTASDMGTFIDQALASEDPAKYLTDFASALNSQPEALAKRTDLGELKALLTEKQSATAPLRSQDATKAKGALKWALDGVNQALATRTAHEKEFWGWFDKQTTAPHDAPIDTSKLEALAPYVNFANPKSKAFPTYAALIWSLEAGRNDISREILGRKDMADLAQNYTHHYNDSHSRKLNLLKKLSPVLGDTALRLDPYPYIYSARDFISDEHLAALTAAQKGNPEAVNALMPSQPKRNELARILIAACESRDPETIAAVLAKAHPEDVLNRAKKGQSVLEWAAEQDNLPATRLMLNRLDLEDQRNVFDATISKAQGKSAFWLLSQRVPGTVVKHYLARQLGDVPQKYIAAAKAELDEMEQLYKSPNSYLSTLAPDVRKTITQMAKPRLSETAQNGVVASIWEGDLDTLEKLENFWGNDKVAKLGSTYLTTLAIFAQQPNLIDHFLSLAARAGAPPQPPTVAMAAAQHDDATLRKLLLQGASADSSAAAKSTEQALLQEISKAAGLSKEQTLIRLAQLRGAANLKPEQRADYLRKELFDSEHTFFDRQGLEQFARSMESRMGDVGLLNRFGQIKQTHASEVALASRSKAPLKYDELVKHAAQIRHLTGQERAQYLANLDQQDLHPFDSDMLHLATRYEQGEQLSDKKKEILRKFYEDVLNLSFIDKN